MSDFYDQDLNPMTLKAWSRAFEDQAKRIVGNDTFPGGYVVSTVWLGLDHNYGSGPPLIFETMCFGAPQVFQLEGMPPRIRLGNELFMERYTTKEEARQGHRRAVRKARIFAAKRADNRERRKRHGRRIL